MSQSNIQSTKSDSPPTESDMVDRVATFIASVGKSNETSMEALFAAAQPATLVKLAVHLVELVHDRILEKIVRVTSSKTGAVLFECTSLMEIPEKMDHGAEHGLQPVLMEEIRSYYKIL